MSRPKLHPDQLIAPGLLFGLFMIGAGFILTGMLRREALPDAWYPTDHILILEEVVLGLVFGIVGATMVWIMTERFASVQSLRDRIVDIIEVEKIRPRHALAFGLLAGIPEEILFRGALQPIIGLLGASILFGLAHAVTRLYMVYAIIAGLLLGLLAQWRGDIWASTAAHFAYDAGLFLLLAVWARKQAEEKEDV
jgi:hypothetical protein